MGVASAVPIVLATSSLRNLQHSNASVALLEPTACNMVFQKHAGLHMRSAWSSCGLGHLILENAASPFRRQHMLPVQASLQKRSHPAGSAFPRTHDCLPCNYQLTATRFHSAYVHSLPRATNQASDQTRHRALGGHLMSSTRRSRTIIWVTSSLSTQGARPMALGNTLLWLLTTWNLSRWAHFIHCLFSPTTTMQHRGKRPRSLSCRPGLGQDCQSCKG